MRMENLTREASNEVQPTFYRDFSWGRIWSIWTFPMFISDIGIFHGKPHVSI
jgi:hypothetical protein